MFKINSYIVSILRKRFVSVCLTTIVVYFSIFQSPRVLGAEIFTNIVANVEDLNPGVITQDALVYSEQVNFAVNEVTNSIGDSAAILEGEEILFETRNIRFSPPFGFIEQTKQPVQRQVNSATPDPNSSDFFAFAEAGFQPPETSSDPNGSQFNIFGKAFTFRETSTPVSVLTSESESTTSDNNPSSQQNIDDIGIEPPVTIQAAPPQQSGYRGRWPANIGVGEFDYAPFINEISVEIDESEFLNEFVGIVIFGEDSRFSEPLWELTIEADQFLTDSSQVVIGFASHPLLNLDDELVANQVRSAFSVIDGVATLNSHVLFKTTYTVTEPTVFGEGIVGVVTSVPIPGPFKCYLGKQFPPFTEDNPRLPFPAIARVKLNDQFASRKTDVRFLKGLCNPAGKDAPVDTARTDHLSCYTITDAPGQAPFFPPRRVTIETENFGEDTVRLGHAFELCVSASKNTDGGIAGTALKCYNARSAQRDFPNITLDDQFFTDEPARIKRLSRLCTPVGIDGPAPPELSNTFDHLACYDIDRRFLQPFIKVDLLDRFIEDAVGQDINFTTALKHRFCEPARKLSVEDRFFAAP